MNNQYTEDVIRKRPGIYVGSTDVRGVYYLILGLIKLIIDSRKTQNIFMIILIDEQDTFHLECDFPLNIKDHFEIEIIKALSCSFDICIEQDFFKIKFTPDREIFSYDTIEYYTLLGRLKELAQLNDNIKFLFKDCKNKNVIQFHNGLEAMLMEGIYEFYFPESHNPIYINFTKNDIEISASMIYTGVSDITLSYVNYSKTPDGGTHVNGLIDGLHYAFQKYIQTFGIKCSSSIRRTMYIDNIDKNIKIAKEDVTKGLNFVISIRMTQPTFAGATKRELVTKEIYSTVKNGVIEHIESILNSDKSFFDSSRVIHKAGIRILRGKEAITHC